MLGDVTILRGMQFGDAGSKQFAVASGTAASINAGEPVTKALGAAAVSSMTTNKPVVATDFLAGISATTSNETASLAGVVQVFPLVDNVVYLCRANNTALWDTQAEYDALVGDRVLFDKTTGTYTVLATDGATNGLVVEPLDIKRYPGMVAFSIRSGVNYLS